MPNLNQKHPSTEKLNREHPVQNTPDNEMEDLRLNPQLRLCAKFDETSIAKFRVAAPGKMGMRVVDNCAEEHIM